MIDVQNAFFEAGALEEVRERLVEHCNQLIAWGRENDLVVANIRTEHRDDRSTWTLNMLEDDKGFLIEGDHDAQPLEDLDLDGTQDVVKTRDDAFLGTELATVLAERDVRTLVIAGVSTHSCVATTAAHAYAENFHVVLAEDAIASNRPELHEGTVALLQDEFRFDIRATAAITSAPASELRR
jgi:nicotinamidase-related amidase